jgi:methylenetetrahydrofolate dehydrogenase (NAD+)
MYQNIRYLNPPTNTLKSILPCTPLALIKILEYLHIYSPHLPQGNRLFGHTILVINRSEVVGRPLAALLANDGATVYSADVSGVQQFTRGTGIRKQRHEVHDLPAGTKMEDVVPRCDVVITGVPGEGFKFPCALLREGAVCVNFSTDKVMQSASMFYLLRPIHPSTLICFCYPDSTTNLSKPNRISVPKSKNAPPSTSPPSEK